jgi:hypothetical protein
MQKVDRIAVRSAVRQASRDELSKMDGVVGDRSGRVERFPVDWPLGGEPGGPGYRLKPNHVRELADRAGRAACKELTITAPKFKDRLDHVKLKLLTDLNLAVTDIICESEKIP